MTLGLFGGAAVAQAAWVVVELRVRTPLVNMRMLARRGVWTTNVAGIAFGMATFGSFLLGEHASHGRLRFGAARGQAAVRA